MNTFYITTYEEHAGNNAEADKQSAHSHEEAATQELELDHPNYDYVDEQEFWVWLDGEKPRKFVATAIQVYHFSATEA